MTNNKKYYGIRLPFTAKDDENFFIDIDSNPYAEIKSDLLHLLFTPVGQRLRNPTFGSKLIRYIFEPNDDQTVTDIKMEMKEMIKKYFPGIVLTDLKVNKEINNQKEEINITIDYRIDEGVYVTFDSINIKL